MNVKNETLVGLKAIKANCRRGELSQVIIDKMSQETFLWIINQAIAQIKDNKIDWRDN